MQTTGDPAPKEACAIPSLAPGLRVVRSPVSPDEVKFAEKVSITLFRATFA